MRPCPTSNMNRTELWGFEVSHIVISVLILAISNVALNIFAAPLVISWFLGLATLVALRAISHGQKNGHLELLVRFIFEPHLFLGHKNTKKKGTLCGNTHSRKD